MDNGHVVLHGERDIVLKRLREGGRAEGAVASAAAAAPATAAPATATATATATPGVRIKMAAPRANQASPAEDAA